MFVVRFVIAPSSQELEPPTIPGRFTVLVDKRGTILKYNRMEQEIAGRTDPKRVLGRNWFREVAPCTRSREFYGKFLSGVAVGRLDAIFDYNFDYKMSPQRVRIHMKNANVKDAYWIFVKRILG